MDADVGIVGAGPAGAVAARTLARAGARVLLFDGSHPREKPCGGGVSGRAVAEVSDLATRLAATATVITSITFEGDSDRTVRVTLPGTARFSEPTLLVTSRRTLDALLLDEAVAAGARFIRTRVRAIDVGRRTARIDTSRGRYTVGFLVGADGAASLVRRSVASAFRRDQLSVATGFFAHGVTSHEITIRFAYRPPGYFWSFPRPDHLAFGVCAPADVTAVDPLRESARRWMRATGIGADVRLERYSWPIPSLGSTDLATERPAAGHWMLVGDAAGLVDPITREGIFFALRSGRYAAAALVGAAPSPIDAYLASLQGEIYPELYLATQLKHGFFRGGFIRLLFDGLEQSEAIRQVMVDLVAGRQSYRGLTRRLLETLELKLAWRLLRMRRARPAVS